LSMICACWLRIGGCSVIGARVRIRIAQRERNALTAACAVLPVAFRFEGRGGPGKAG
jgi:hypothetical protein